MFKISNFRILKTLMSYGWAVRRKNWWRRFPFIPIPPRRWILWRMETAWGIDAQNPKWADFPPIKIMLRDMWRFGRWLCFIAR